MHDDDAGAEDDEVDEVGLGTELLIERLRERLWDELDPALLSMLRSRA